MPIILWVQSATVYINAIGAIKCESLTSDVSIAVEDGTGAAKWEGPAAEVGKVGRNTMGFAALWIL